MGIKVSTGDGGSRTRVLQGKAQASTDIAAAYSFGESAEHQLSVFLLHPGKVSLMSSRTVTQGKFRFLTNTPGFGTASRVPVAAYAAKAKSADSLLSAVTFKSSFRS